MKLRVVLITAFLLIMAFGTTTHAGTHSLSISPFVFADGLIAAEYEWRGTYNSTRVLHVGFESDAASSSLVAGYGTHVYLSGRVLDGPYFGASGIIVTTSNSNPSDNDFDALELTFNGRAGLKWNFEPLIVDFALKFEVPMFTWSDSGSKLGMGKIRNKVGLGLGYSW